MRQQNWFWTLDGFAGPLAFQFLQSFIKNMFQVLWEWKFQRRPTKIATPWWRAYFASSQKCDHPNSYNPSKTRLKCPQHLEKLPWLLWKVSARSSQRNQWNNSAGTLHRFKQKVECYSVSPYLDGKLGFIYCDIIAYNHNYTQNVRTHILAWIHAYTRMHTCLHKHIRSNSSPQVVCTVTNGCQSCLNWTIMSVPSQNTTCAALRQLISRIKCVYLTGLLEDDRRKELNGFAIASQESTLDYNSRAACIWPFHTTTL
jgi:hypothetical protein